MDVDGKKTVRKGDKAVCVIHGQVTVVEGSGIMDVEGKPQARVGDALSCGAKITAGSPNMEVG